MRKEEKLTFEEGLVLGILGSLFVVCILTLIISPSAEVIPVKTLNELCADTHGKEYMYGSLVKNYDTEKDYTWFSIECVKRPAEEKVQEEKSIINPIVFVEGQTK